MLVHVPFGLLGYLVSGCMSRARNKPFPSAIWKPHKPLGQQPPVDGGGGDRTWPSTLMALGVVLWLAVFWGLGQRTLITYGTLFRWFALFAFAGDLLPYAWSGRRLGMERLEWFFFNLFAVGPFLFALFLGINFLFSGTEVRYVVRQAHHVDPPLYWIQHGQLPHGIPYAEYESGRSNINSVRHGDVMLGVSPGAFGYEVITTWALIRTEALPAVQVEMLLQLERESLADQSGLSGHGSFGGEFHLATKGTGDKHHQ